MSAVDCDPDMFGNHSTINLFVFTWGMINATLAVMSPFQHPLEPWIADIAVDTVSDDELIRSKI